METTFSYKLEQFEGPLDLLLQLIAKNKLDIYDIKLTVLIDQYLEQIEKMQENDADISSEFIEMASRLLHMKTVKLLPKHEEFDQLKDEFIGELLEYQTCRMLAKMLEENMGGFDNFVKTQSQIELPKTYVLVHPAETLLNSYISAIGRGKRRLPPNTAPFATIVARKIVSVSTRIVYVMRNLVSRGPQKLKKLYLSSKSRSELVATFLAVLELCKANRITVEGSGEDAELILNKEKK